MKISKLVDALVKRFGGEETDTVLDTKSTNNNSVGADNKKEKDIVVKIKDHNKNDDIYPLW